MSEASFWGLELDLGVALGKIVSGCLPGANPTGLVEDGLHMPMLLRVIVLPAEFISDLESTTDKLAASVISSFLSHPAGDCLSLSRTF